MTASAINGGRYLLRTSVAVHAHSDACRISKTEYSNNRPQLLHSPIDSPPTDAQVLHLTAETEARDLMLAVETTRTIPLWTRPITVEQARPAGARR